MREYAPADPQLQHALAALRTAERVLEFRGYAAPVAKEAYYASQLHELNPALLAFGREVEHDGTGNFDFPDRFAGRATNDTDR